jgi:hypothetical protein
MAVSITTIQGSDNVGLSRLTINANFAALKAASDAVTALLDPTTASLSGVKSVQIDNAASALSSSIFSVSKGASILGNMTLGTIGASTSVSIRGTGGVSISEGSLSIGLGNLSMVSTSLLTGGNVSVVGEKRAPGLATAFTNTVGLTGNVSVAVATKKYIVLSNTTPAGLTATLQSGSADGQVVEIYHTLGATGGVVSINTNNFVGLTGGIQMTETGDKLECIYDSGNWYLWDYTESTPGAGSISFTRI